MHRSDGSGTSYIWCDYLSKVSPDYKKTVGVATSVNWPVGVGAKGNESVAGLVKHALAIAKDAREPGLHPHRRFRHVLQIERAARRVVKPAAATHTLEPASGGVAVLGSSGGAEKLGVKLLGVVRRAIDADER